MMGDLWGALGGVAGRPQEREDRRQAPPEPHSRRTSCILAAANVPPRLVAGPLGHAKPVVTETHDVVTGMDTRRAGMLDGMKLLAESAKQLEKRGADASGRHPCPP